MAAHSTKSPPQDNPLPPQIEEWQLADALGSWELAF
jgi:hypothetical protein